MSIYYFNDRVMSKKMAQRLIRPKQKRIFPPKKFRFSETSKKNPLSYLKKIKNWRMT